MSHTDAPFLRGRNETKAHSFERSKGKHGHQAQPDPHELTEDSESDVGCWLRIYTVERPAQIDGSHEAEKQKVDQHILAKPYVPERRYQNQCQQLCEEHQMKCARSQGSD